MTMQNKIHNRTLFVAALSVYFGLLIVGAPSQAFAQTQKIVLVSNQDNRCQNPSQQAEELLSKDFFVVAVADFAKELKELSKVGKLDLNDKSNLSLSLTVLARKDGTNLLSLGRRNTYFYALPAFSKTARNISGQIDKDALLYSQTQLFEPFSPESVNLAAAKQDLSFELNKKGFTTKTAFGVVSAEKAASLTNLYNQVFALGVCREKPNAVFYQNTTATFENNQVFIVTHLPRAAIDEFLKADAKPSEK